MTTPRDNSNITDVDVLEAKTKLANAKAYKVTLEASIAKSTKWLKDNPSPTIFALASDAVVPYVNGMFTYRNPVTDDKIAS